MIVLLLPFLFGFLLFFSSLIAVVRTSDTVLSKSDEWASLSCSWLYRKCFHLPTTEYDGHCGIVLYHLYYVDVYFLYTTLWTVFYHKCWIVSKAFSASTEMIVWCVFFNLLKWCIILIDLPRAENLYIPRINPTWLSYKILLMYYWIWFAIIFVKDFYIYVRQWYWPVIFFFYDIFFWFCIGVTLAS